jgi:hypothetical protein
MKDTNGNILKKAIAELPNFVCGSESMWQNIEKSLPEETTNTLADVLPEYILPKDIWPAIEQDLDNRKIHKIRFAYLRIAAGIVALIGLGFLVKEFVGYKADKGTITYSVETVDNSNLHINEIIQDIPENENIKTLCQNNPVVCSTQQFEELTRQFDDVTGEMQEITKIIKENNDPQLLRYYYRLENQKAEIEKKMIRIITQS